MLQGNFNQLLAPVLLKLMLVNFPLLPSSTRDRPNNLKLLRSSLLTHVNHLSRATLISEVPYSVIIVPSIMRPIIWHEGCWRAGSASEW